MAREERQRAVADHAYHLAIAPGGVAHQVALADLIEPAAGALDLQRAAALGAAAGFVGAFFGALALIWLWQTYRR